MPMRKLHDHDDKQPKDMATGRGATSKSSIKNKIRIHQQFEHLIIQNAAIFLYCNGHHRVQSLKQSQWLPSD